MPAFTEFNTPNEAIPNLFKRRLVFWGMGSLLVCTGNTSDRVGVGKTENTAAMFDRIDRDFSIEKVATNPDEYLDGLEKIENDGRAGQCMMMDECQISASNVSFMSWNNKAIVYATSTQRYLKCLTGFVTPSWSFIDKRLRILSSWWMYPTLKGRGNDKWAELHIFKIKTDLFGEKIYFQKLRFFDNINKKVVVGGKFVVKPRLREDLRKQIDDKLKVYKANVRKDLQKESVAMNKALEKTEGKINIAEYAEKAKVLPEVNQDLLQHGKLTHYRIQEKFPELNRDYARDVAGIINLRWSGKRNG